MEIVLLLLAYDFRHGSLLAKHGSLRKPAQVSRLSARLRRWDPHQSVLSCLLGPLSFVRADVETSPGSQYSEYVLDLGINSSTLDISYLLSKNLDRAGKLLSKRQQGRNAGHVSAYNTSSKFPALIQ